MILGQAVLEQTANKGAAFPMQNENPKLDPNPGINSTKDPDEWVSGEDPMTGAQASYLRRFRKKLTNLRFMRMTLTKAEARKRIDALKRRMNEGVQKRARR